MLITILGNWCKLGVYNHIQPNKKLHESKRIQLTPTTPKKEKDHNIAINCFGTALGNLVNILDKLHDISTCLQFFIQSPA